jgi:prepilin peptidase CpaA
LAIALCAPLYWWASALPFWPDAALQVAVALAVFLLFAGLFALGMMGGGDVKMLAALALWLPWQPLLVMLMLMALLGGAITLITVVHHRWSRRTGQPEIPYGVAIALAALWVIGKPIVNHFA